MDESGVTYPIYRIVERLESHKRLSGMVLQHHERDSIFHAYHRDVIKHLNFNHTGLLHLIRNHNTL